LSDQDGAGDDARDDGGRKRRSFTEAVALFDPIVPLPGTPDSLYPVTGPPPILAPPRPPAPAAREPPNPPASPPIAAPMVAAPAAAAPVVASPAVPPTREEVSQPPLAEAQAHPVRPSRRRLWPWATLLALGAAGIGAVWVQRIPHPLPATPVAALPPPQPAPKAEAPPPADAPEPTVAAPSAPPAPLPDAAPILAAPALPSAPPAPDPNPPASADRRVIIHFRRASSEAGAEAARLATQLQPFAAQVDTRTATVVPRLPTIRYFHAADAAAAQDLANAIPSPAGAWRVQSVATRRTRPPPGTFEVWLPTPDTAAGTR
jgi:hypothetical protein